MTGAFIRYILSHFEVEADKVKIFILKYIIDLERFDIIFCECQVQTSGKHPTGLRPMLRSSLEASADTSNRLHKLLQLIVNSSGCWCHENGAWGTCVVRFVLIYLQMTGLHHD